MKRYILFLLIFSLFFSSCSKEKEIEENTEDEKLLIIKEQKELINALTRESDKMNDTLNTIIIATDSLTSEQNITKQGALDKITMIGLQLDNSHVAIDSLRQELEVKIENSSTPYETEYLKNKIEELNTQLAKISSQKNVTNSLETALQKERKAKVNMKRLVSKLKDDIVEKDNIIAAIREKRKQEQEELQKLMAKLESKKAEINNASRNFKSTEKEIKKMKQEIASLKNKIAKSYYDTGQELASIVKNSSGITKTLAKKHMKKLINEAYQKFQTAHNLGYAPAQHEYLALKQNYPKYFKK